MSRVRSVKVLVLALSLAGALTACQQEAPRAAASPSSTATSSSPTAAATATSSTGTTTPTSASASSSAPVLGPDGLGSLKLGMTRGQAEATGMVEPFENKPNSDRCLWRSRLRAAPAGKGIVFYSETLGVATVDAYEGTRTPEGITIGSSLAEVQQAYPGWRYNDLFSRGYAGVPGHDQLVYRIALTDGKVAQLTLQYVHQDCYE